MTNVINVYNTGLVFSLLHFNPVMTLTIAISLVVHFTGRQGNRLRNQHQ